MFHCFRVYILFNTTSVTSQVTISSKWHNFQKSSTSHWMLCSSRIYPFLQPRHLFFACHQRCPQSVTHLVVPLSSNAGKYLSWFGKADDWCWVVLVGLNVCSVITRCLRHLIAWAVWTDEKSLSWWVVVHKPKIRMWGLPKLYTNEASPALANCCYALSFPKTSS